MFVFGVEVVWWFECVCEFLVFGQQCVDCWFEYVVDLCECEFGMQCVVCDGLVVELCECVFVWDYVVDVCVGVV